MLLSAVFVSVCVCLYVWPREDAEMKVTGQEVPSYHKWKHEVSPG